MGLALFALLAAWPAGAAGLCGRLFVPDDYALICETRIEDAKRSERVLVRPSNGASMLAGLALRPLKEAEEPLAWEVPELWLREQVALDLSGITSMLRAASDSGPLAELAVRATVDGLITMLSAWGQLPHRACIPDHRSGQHQLRCTWGVVPPVAVQVMLRLIEAGDERYAISYWGVGERRLRHLEAIANSFAPTGAAQRQ